MKKDTKVLDNLAYSAVCVDWLVNDELRPLGLVYFDFKVLLLGKYIEDRTDFVGFTVKEIIYVEGMTICARASVRKLFKAGFLVQYRKAGGLPYKRFSAAWRVSVEGELLIKKVNRAILRYLKEIEAGSIAYRPEGGYKVD